MTEESLSMADKKTLLALIGLKLLGYLVLFGLLYGLYRALQFNETFASEDFPFFIKFIVISVVVIYFGWKSYKWFALLFYFINGKIKKITAVFSVESKEEYYPSESFSPNYYLHVFSQEASQTFCFPVSENDYVKIKTKELITLQYYSKINILLRVVANEEDIEILSSFLK